MPLDPANLSPEVREFLTERHLASFTLVSANGVPHVTPVGFTWDDDAGLARIITFAASKKARLLASGPLTAALCQVDGGRWLALHGLATLSADADVNADAESRYGVRYRPPKDRGADRRTIVIDVGRLLGRA